MRRTLTLTLLALAALVALAAAPAGAATITAKAGSGGVTAKTLVKLSAAGTIVTATAVTDSVVGVCEITASADAMTSYSLPGTQTTVTSGEAVTIGDLLTAGASGKAFVLDADDASTQRIAAVALTAATDADQDVTVVILAAVAEQRLALGGNVTVNADLTLDGETAGYDVVWDRSDNALEFADAAELGFGTGASGNCDMKLVYAAANTLTLSQEVDGTGNLILGAAGTNGMDTTLQSKTAGDLILFDAGLKRLETEDCSIMVADDDALLFGDGASSDGDISLAYSASGNTLTVAQVADGTGKLVLGQTGTHGLDIDILSAAADDKITWDAGTKQLTFEDSTALFGVDDRIFFGDSAVFIESDDDGYLDLDADTGIRLNAATAVATSLTVSGAGTFATGTGNVALNGDVTIAADKDLNMSGTGTVTTGTGDVTVNGDMKVAAAKYILAPGVVGTKVRAGTPIRIVFLPTIGESLSWTVPTGYDLLVLNAYGFKTAAAGDNAADQWDLQNDDGTAANIFATEELNAITDGTFCQFDGHDDTEWEVESGDALKLVAGEDSDDDGADGIIVVEGILKVAD